MTEPNQHECAMPLAFNQPGHLWNCVYCGQQYKLVSKFGRASYWTPINSRSQKEADNAVD